MEFIVDIDDSVDESNQENNIIHDNTEKEAVIGSGDEDFSKYLGGSIVLNRQSINYDEQLKNNKDDIISSLIPNTISACSLTADNPTICVSDHALKIIDEKINKEDKADKADKKNKSIDSPIDMSEAIVAGAVRKTPEEIMEKAKRKLGCKDERCVIESEDFKSAAGKQIATLELSKNFKVKGPTNVDLLSNINIDTTLKQWHETKFPRFYPYNFNMLDYEKERDSLATVDVMDLWKNGYRTAACVINSDVYSGRGKHWMALFLDMRTNPMTVEFFNSSGNAPDLPWVNWMMKTKSRLEEIQAKYSDAPQLPPEIIKVTGLRHQNTITECGVFSAAYIWLRLHEISPEYFKEHVIDDKLMFEFRLHLFHDPRDKSEWYGKEFDYSKFKDIAKWEPGVKDRRQ